MVDKQEHSSDACGAIGDVLEMDNALKVAQAYQAAHPDTLIIVTGDHAHSTQIVPNGPSTTTDATGATTGKATVTVRTADGDPMTIGYSTQNPNDPGPPPVSTSQTHTGAQIRVAASGPQAANITGTIDQTDLFQTMLGRTPSVLPTTPGTPTTPAAVKPIVVVAAAPKVRRAEVRKGLGVSVSASGATSLVVTLTKGTKVLDSQTVAAGGGTVKLKSKKAKGTVTVTATATGAGGSATDSAAVKTKR